MSSYTYSYSELFMAPMDFQFGPSITPKLSNTVQNTVLFTNSNKFHQNIDVDFNPSLFGLSFNSSSIDFILNFDLASYIVAASVNSAVFIKGTSVPDVITDLTENALELGSVMEQHYAIKRKVKKAGHLVVNVIIAILSTFITALLQAMIAYHNAPAVGIDRNERKLIEIEHNVTESINYNDCLVTFCVGGINFTTKLEHLVKRKRTAIGRLVFNRKNLNEPVFVDRDGTHFRHIINHLRGIAFFS
ncbi:hypothetical protein BC833DRAFT_600173 [Globomyces pollinis-pini]|nr:hypothetical protein BC833DRAFT_600173 [Globomyces pollinis-pini]